MKKPYEILVLQTSGSELFLAAAAKLPGLNYGLFSTTREIRRLVSPNKQQLLIMGIINPGQNLERAFLAELREINPDLVAISFASMPIGGDFEVEIEKTSPGSSKELARNILQFLDGELVRKKFRAFALQ